MGIGSSRVRNSLTYFSGNLVSMVAWNACFSATEVERASSWVVLRVKVALGSASFACLYFFFASAGRSISMIN